MRSRSKEYRVLDIRKIRCAETFCDDCHYCHDYAERAVSYDRDDAASLVGDIGELIDESMTAKW